MALIHILLLICCEQEVLSHSAALTEGLRLEGASGGRLVQPHRSGRATWS